MTTEIQVWYIVFYNISCNIKEQQAAVLDEASRTHPNAWWWVKTDGCDLIEGLGESTRLDWSGDIDMNDGELQAAYKIYRERLGIHRRDLAEILEDLDVCMKGIKDDITFSGTGVLCTCAQVCNSHYFLYSFTGTK